MACWMHFSSNVARMASVPMTVISFEASVGRIAVASPVGMKG